MLMEQTMASRKSFTFIFAIVISLMPLKTVKYKFPSKAVAIVGVFSRCSFRKTQLESRAACPGADWKFTPTPRIKLCRPTFVRDPGGAGPFLPYFGAGVKLRPLDSAAPPAAFLYSANRDFTAA